jgi:hypothetical protein
MHPQLHWPEQEAAMPEPQPQPHAKLDALHAERVSLQCKIAVTASSPALTAHELGAMFTQLAQIQNEIAQLQGGSFDASLKLAKQRR